MQLDSPLVADTKAWVKKARQDLRAAEVDLAADSPIIEDALFPAQQAAEKSIKAFLFWHDRPFRKTHDLRELLDLACPIEPGIEELRSTMEALTPLAWEFRYPGESEEPSVDETNEYIQVANDFYQKIMSFLPDDIRI
jgi:HEPN domain-containing protein